MTITDIKKYTNKIFWGIIVFFLVFAFPIIPALSSAKIVLLIVLFIILSKHSLKKQIYLINSQFNRYFTILSLLILFTLSQTILFFQFDYSLSFKILSSFILYFLSYFVYSEIKNIYNIPNLLIWCFVFQSIFIILAILSQAFYDLTQVFRGNELSEEHIQAYGRLRGNAISGYQFFGISSMYTFVYIYFLLHLKKFKHRYIILLLLTVAGICSGRYAITGILISIIFILIRFLWEGKIIKTLKIVIITAISICIMIFSIYKIAENIEDPIMFKIVERYILQPIDSLIEEGQLETTSTNSLEDMYDSEEIKKYFILGSGRYTNDDGSYFGYVDIGYYRMLGYYGIIGYIFVWYATYYLIFRTNSKLDTITKYAFFVNFIVLNIKGDVNIWNNNLVPILVAFLFFNNSTINKNQKLMPY